MGHSSRQHRQGCTSIHIGHHPTMGTASSNTGWGSGGCGQPLLVVVKHAKERSVVGSTHSKAKHCLNLIL